jgi:hypothetical protein
MAEAEFKREVGSGEQLPYGEAADLNRRLASVAPQTGTGLPSELAEAEPDDYKPQNEREEILFGPPEGLGRHLPPTAPVDRRVPPSVVRRLPALARAASRPDAPPALVAMYKLTLQRLEDEMRNGG